MLRKSILHKITLIFGEKKIPYVVYQEETRDGLTDATNIWRTVAVYSTVRTRSPLLGHSSQVLLLSGSLLLREGVLDELMGRSQWSGGRRCCDIWISIQFYSSH